MAIKPNLVVGVVGLVVFLLTGSFILTNWEGLTGLEEWDVAVDEESRPLRDRAGFAAPGKTTDIAFPNPYQNVTAVFLRLDWSEGGGTPVAPARHEVTMSLHDPAGHEVAVSPPTAGGSRGITLEPHVRDVPKDVRFGATAEARDDEFEERYPPHPEDVGNWTLRLVVSKPEGGTGISYRLSIDVDFYVAAPPQKVERPEGVR